MIKWVVLISYFVFILSCFGPSQSYPTSQQIAFVSDSYGGLWSVDLAEPAQPTEITRLRTDSVVQDLKVNGEFVF